MSELFNSILICVPSGMLGITTNTFGTQRLGTAIPLGKFIGTSYLIVNVLVGITFPIMMKAFGIETMKLYKNVKEVAFIPLITSISTLPNLSFPGISRYHWSIDIGALIAYL
ncbi:cation:dicarboxylate symporter family transporter [Psychrobacter frigidicola]|uniref:cation:dicarboxylate symporter family transporter n=1 Tax=Psychrobacter frigidicola TaxID=45611 RepID=UPI003B8492EA